MCLELFESQDSQILAFQCVREFLTCSRVVSAYHDKSICSFDLFYVFIGDGECVGGLGEGSNFSIGLEGLTIDIFKQKEQFELLLKVV